MNILGINNKINKAMEAAKQERRDKVYKQIQAVLDAENMLLITFLEYTAVAVLPRWTLAEKPKEKNEERKTN